MNTLRVDLRGGATAADPLLKPFRQCGVAEFQPATQSTLPDNQHTPAKLAKPQHVSPIALHIFTDFVQPELGTRGGNFEQVAVMMMPETAVREDNAAILIHDKIRASGQRGVLHMKRHPLLLQQSGKAFFYRRIARGYRPHILAARRLIVYVRHAGSLSGAM